MIRYIIGRLLWIIPVLFVVTIITFGLMHAVPGGPWAREKALPAPTVARLNIKYGLDDPVPVQYVTWVTGLLQGNLGPSFKFADRSVNDMRHLPWNALERLTLRETAVLHSEGIFRCVTP